jgi:hypothetical protein
MIYWLLVIAYLLLVVLCFINGCNSIVREDLYKKESQGYISPMTFPENFLIFYDALFCDQFSIPIVLIAYSYWLGVLRQVRSISPTDL